MIMRGLFYIICSLLLLMSGGLQAQESSTLASEDVERSTNSATMIGVGGYNLMDTYLSPGLESKRYTGIGFRVMNERMRMLRDERFSRQQVISVDFATTENGAASATDLAGFVDYSLGYHYHLQELMPGLRLMAGGSAHGMAGFIYNTRNGNNPASAKADIDLNISAMAIYRLKIGNYPITMRYQFSMPFAGIMFSPHYGQSYYEIFDLGNSSGVVKFNSFHNKIAFRNFITADLPVGNFTIRAGFLNSAYRTDVNGIKSHIISNSFMIGIVKEIISFGGKRLDKRNRFKSSYY